MGRYFSGKSEDRSRDQFGNKLNNTSKIKTKYYVLGQAQKIKHDLGGKATELTAMFCLENTVLIRKSAFTVCMTNVFVML